MKEYGRQEQERQRSHLTGKSHAGEYAVEGQGKAQEKSFFAAQDLNFLSVCFFRWKINGKDDIELLIEAQYALYVLSTNSLGKFNSSATLSTILE